MQKEGFVKWFSELSNKDVSIAGGKGASLAEMYNLRMPIPPGFVVTAQAFVHFMKETKLNEKVKLILTNLNVDNTDELNRASERIREAIENSNIPTEIEEEIVEAYGILDESSGKDAESILRDGAGTFVAVRSSATTEDLADASFAGQQDTFLNVRGKEQLLSSVKKCMSSLFTARAIYYRTKKGFPHEKSYLAVVVQKMINSVKSGVIFSKNPTGDDNSIVIEAVWGLGEGIVSGRIKPDHYVADENVDEFKIKEIKLAVKKTAIVKNDDGTNGEVQLDEEISRRQVLDNYEIKRLAQYAKQSEAHYGKPQDMEFAIDEKTIYIVQSRPITTVFKKNDYEVKGEELLKGLGASPGISSGKVKVVHDLKELSKVEQGDVLVTEMTNPDMVVTMQRAAAIVTDEGGVTSHAAIVSREMGIPAVVGTGDATKRLKDGEIVTVDGSSGKVYEGKGKTQLVEIKPLLKTNTEIKVIVDLPEYASRAAKSGARAVGLARLEGIIATSGKHPLKFVKEGKTSEYVSVLLRGIKGIAEHFEEVWVRTSDIRTDEFRNLDGSPEEIEGNPMLGDHGVRYSLKHKEIMLAELKAIKEAAHELPKKIIGVMIPQVISAEEVRDTKKLAQEIKMPGNVRFGIMVETPAAVQIIEELCNEGIDFMSFGTNDLTQYTLAIDRNNEEVQSIYNEMHPAVLKSLSHVIRVCKKRGVATSICGQAGSREEMARFLIAEGIDSISVNADAARKISELVARLEGSESFEAGSVSVAEKTDEKEIETRQIAHHKKHQELFDDRDMEEVVLEELGNGDYMPGYGSKEELPSLNDAIPIDSESFSEPD